MRKLGPHFICSALFSYFPHFTHFSVTEGIYLIFFFTWQETVTLRHSIHGWKLDFIVQTARCHPYRGGHKT